MTRPVHVPEPQLCADCERAFQPFNAYILSVLASAPGALRRARERAGLLQPLERPHGE